jgi:hypothetical protein
MKTMQAKRHGVSRKLLWMTSLISVAALVAACGGGGGGGDSAATGGGATAGVFSGPISGLGSVIVNGVRFDDSAAKVSLDDDDVARASDVLRLGMVVEIEGSRNDDGTTGRADAIGSHSIVRGPITGTPSATQFSVLGMTVTVTPSTAYEGVAGLAGLAAGTMVEIHGIADGPDGVTATRVETTGNDEVRLTGAVTGLNAGQTTFKLHGTVINYASATGNLPVIAENSIVRVKGTLATAPTAVPATITAKRVQLRNPLKKNGLLLELEGAVTKFTSATDFEVNGTKVLVTSGAKVEGTLGLNLRVEVSGTVDANGVLNATKVEVKATNVVAEAEFEVHGTIGNYNPATRTFTLTSGNHSVPVHLTAKPAFLAPLTEALLANNVKVEVKGKVVNGTVEVTSIKTDN